MGEPWQLVPDGDRCAHCGAEPVHGFCPNCKTPVPPPVTRLWPFYYVGVLSALLMILLPYLSKKQIASSPLIVFLLAVMSAAVFCSVLCVVYFVRTVRRGKDKRILLRFTLSNFILVVGCAVLFALNSIFQ